MSLVSKINKLTENEKVLLFCNNDKLPNLYRVKKINKKSDTQTLVIFINKSENKKLGIKISNDTISYPKINIKFKCKTITDLVSEADTDIFDKYLGQIKYKSLKTRERKYLLPKKNLTKIKITSGNFKINKIQTTIKKNIKTYIKKLIELDKVNKGFINLLKDRDPTSYYTEKDANIFTSMIPNKKEFLKIQELMNLEYRPILDNLKDNYFNLTNIDPIVIDRQKLYFEKDDVGVSSEINDSLQNSFVLKTLQNLYSKTSDTINYPGDLLLELNINKEFSKRNTHPLTVKSYIDCNRKLYGEEGTNAEIFLNKEFNQAHVEGDESMSMDDTTKFDPPKLDYLKPDNAIINRRYYNVKLKYTNNLYRLSYKSSNNKETTCMTLQPNSDTGFKLTSKTSNSIISRKSTDYIPCFTDVFDNVKIGTTKTCNGTNKSGDIFYLGTDFKSSELNKSQSKPPKITPIYSGEEVYICGFYIHSPNYYNNNIFGGPELYDSQNNSKQYKSLYTNYKTVLDIKDFQSSRPVKIIENIDNFVDYNNYDPNNDYYVLIGKADESSRPNLEVEQVSKIIKFIAPNIQQIFSVILPELEDIESIQDVEKILNKYYLTFSELPKSYYIDIIKNKILLNNNQDSLKIFEHQKNSINLKNQSNVLNNLYRELLNSNLDEFNFLEFFSKHRIKKVHHKKFLEKMYNFISNKKPKSLSNLEEQIINIIKQKFNNKISNHSYGEEINILKDFYSKIQTANISYKNIHFSKNLLENIIKINNSRRNPTEQTFLRNILELKNLYRIKNIISDEKSKYDFDLTEKIPELQTEIEGIISNYNAERELQLDFLDKCRGIRIVKEYNSLQKVNKDNAKTIYRDLQYDTLYFDLYTLYKLIKDPISLSPSNKKNLKQLNDDINDRFIDELNNVYIYLDKKSIQIKIEETIEFYNNLQLHMQLYPDDPNIDIILDSLNNFDIKNKSQFFNLTINGEPVKNRINPDDIALLKEYGNKYLFKRSGSVWHIITEEEFSETPKSFTYTDKKILQLNHEDLEKIFSKVVHSSIDQQATCINVEEYSIPKPLYLMITKITSKRKFIKNCKVILKYIQTIDSDIGNKLEDLQDIIRQKNILKRQTAIPNITTQPKNKLSLVPKSIVLKYRDIFKEKNFDRQMQNLIQFTELYGIDYCLRDDVDESEKSSETSNFWYYNSSNFTFKLCCKHEMCYKNFIHKSDTERSHILEEIKTKYGEKEGDSWKCRLCGQPIDYIEDSSFEGFDRNNALIIHAESVEQDDSEVEIFKEELSIKDEQEFYDKNSKFPEIIGIKYIASELGIKFNHGEIEYIIGKINEISIDDLYEKFIDTGILKEIMIKSYKFVEAVQSKKKKKKKKKKEKNKVKKKTAQKGGGIKEIKLQADVFDRITGSSFRERHTNIKDGETLDITRLEESFREDLNQEVTRWNDRYTEMRLEPETLLQNIDNINKLLNFLNKSNNSNEVILLLLSNIQKLFNVYIRGFKFIYAIKYLVSILQFGLPEYKINPFLMISKIPSLRQSGNNFLIQNLFHNRDYIINNIFSIMTNTLNLKYKSAGRYLKQIIGIFRHISSIGFIFGVTSNKFTKNQIKEIYFNNNFIIFENSDIDLSKKRSETEKKIHLYFKSKIKKEIENLIIQDAYINNMKVARIKYERERKIDEKDSTYKWNEFLPLIDINLVTEINVRDALKITTDSSVSSYKLTKYLLQLSNNYIYYVNKLIDLIDIDIDTGFYSYTSSHAFQNIRFSFIDFFDIDNFTSDNIKLPFADESDERETFIKYITKLKEILDGMHIINNNLNYRRISQETPIYLFNNNNSKSRNLQEYTDFNSLYTNKPLSYFINRLKLLFTTYYVEPYHLLKHDIQPIINRRIFKTVKDINFDKIKILLDNQIKHKYITSAEDRDDDSEIGEKQEFNIINEYRQLIGDNIDFIAKEILKQDPDQELKENSIFFKGDNEGIYHIDVLSGEFKAKIEYMVDKTYESKNKDELLELIRIIESKISTVRPLIDTSLEFAEINSFKDTYISCIRDVNQLLKSVRDIRGESSQADETNLKNIIHGANTDITYLSENWTEINTISFITNINNIYRKVRDNTPDKYRNLLISVFKTNNYQLNEFYKEKLNEIDSDLRIILMEDNDSSDDLFSREQIFYKNRFENDKNLSVLHIFIYLLKFLMCKVLQICSGYKNNALQDICDVSDKLATSLGSSEINVIKKVYTDRYSELCSDFQLSIDGYRSDLNNLCKNINSLLGLLDNNQLSVSLNIVLIKDLLFKFLYTSNTLFESNDSLELINKLFFDEFSSIFDTYGTREYNIVNYMNVKKTKGNQNRKKKFDQKSDEDKLSHKLYRRFNLGKILDLSDGLYKESRLAESSAEIAEEEGGYDIEDINIDKF